MKEPRVDIGPRPETLMLAVEVSSGGLLRCDWGATTTQANTRAREMVRKMKRDYSEERP